MKLSNDYQRFGVDYLICNKIDIKLNLTVFDSTKEQ